MHLDDKYINLLKKPFGILIKEDNQIKEKSIINKFIECAFKIVTVGDATTKKLINYGFIPDLSIIDGKEQRTIKHDITEYPFEERVYFRNNPGELNENIIKFIQDLVKSEINKKILITIDGEEDLIALPLFVFVPDNWIVFYGQPNEGLVVVKVNKENKKNAEIIFNKVFKK